MNFFLYEDIDALELNTGISNSRPTRNQFRYDLNTFLNHLNDGRIRANNNAYDDMTLALFQTIYNFVHASIHSVFDPITQERVLANENAVQATSIGRYRVISEIRLEQTPLFCEYDRQYVHHDNEHRAIFYIAKYIYNEITIPLEIRWEPNPNIIETWFGRDVLTINNEMFIINLFRNDAYVITNLHHSIPNCKYILYDQFFKFSHPSPFIDNVSFFRMLTISPSSLERIQEIEDKLTLLAIREKAITEREIQFDEDCARYEEEATKWKAIQESKYSKQEYELNEMKKMFVWTNERYHMLMNDRNRLTACAAYDKRRRRSADDDCLRIAKSLRGERSNAKSQNAEHGRHRLTADDVLIDKGTQTDE